MRKTKREKNTQSKDKTAKYLLNNVISSMNTRSLDMQAISIISLSYLRGGSVFVRIDNIVNPLETCKKVQVHTSAPLRLHPPLHKSGDK